MLKKSEILIVHFPISKFRIVILSTRIFLKHIILFVLSTQYNTLLLSSSLLVLIKCLIYCTRRQVTRLTLDRSKVTKKEFTINTPRKHSKRYF